MSRFVKYASLMGVLAVAGLAGPAATAKAGDWGGPGYGPAIAASRSFAVGVATPNVVVGISKGAGVGLPGPGYGYGPGYGPGYGYGPGPIGGYDRFYDRGYGPGHGGHCPPRRPLPPPPPHCGPRGVGYRYDVWSTTVVPYGPRLPW